MLIGADRKGHRVDAGSDGMPHNRLVDEYQERHSRELQDRISSVQSVPGDNADGPTVTRTLAHRQGRSARIRGVKGHHFCWHRQG